MMAPTTSLAFEADMIDRDSVSYPELGVGIFTLDITIGGWSEDLYLPVVGERDLPFASREDRFGFVLETGYDQANADAGSVTALMVAPFEIVDGHYKIPARTLATVKIIALVTVDEEYGDTYGLRVTELPFLSGDDKTPGHFSQPEIKYLYTNKEPFHFERDPE